ncbi:MAG: hypothetical protein IKF82_07705 [Bacilli bacterium]|nr:hypothetical protein [Bacilli bacterium]
MKKFNINKIAKYVPITVTALIFCITLGFSSFTSTSSIIATAKVDPVIDIQIINFTSTTAGNHEGNSSYETHNVDVATTGIYLPYADSTAVYEIELVNLGTDPNGIFEVTGLPNNLEYNFTDYTEQDKICDDNNPTNCSKLSRKTIHMTIGYKQNGYDSSITTYPLTLNFDFRTFHNITYSGFSGTYRDYVIDGGNLNITFDTGDTPSYVDVVGATNNYTSPTLTLTNVTNDVSITKLYSINYIDFTGDISGLRTRIGSEGGTITFNNTTGIPEFVLVTGANSDYNSETHVLTLTNVTSNITVTMASDGIVEIKSITLQDISNVTENSNPQITNDGQGITFDLNVTVDETNIDQDFYAKYAIVINNDSVHEQKVLATNFIPNITGTGNVPNVTYTITDINGNPVLNTTIAPKTSETYYLTINLEPSEHGTWGIEGETTVDTVENGTVTGTISGNTQGDLTGSNTLAHFTATVYNSFEVNKTFTFAINDNKFKIVDSNGNDISSMNIAANTTATYDFYVKNLNGNNFMSSPYSLNVDINYDNITSSIGVVDLLVDIDPTLTDHNAPIINNVTATITSAQKEILVTWSGTDENTITNYYVETYISDASGNGTLYHTETLNGAANGAQVNYTATVPNDNAYYYFKVYAKDQSGNIASANEIASCTTSSGHCTRTNNEKYKWNFKVTLRLTNATSSNGTTTTNGNVRTVTFNVAYDGNINTTLSGAGNSYNAPSSISSATITYANGSSTDLPRGSSSQTAYSYNNSTLNIYHITGDINIEAEGVSTCLAEGTKILMADGTYKNIEDINYDDLLAVWNYDTGKLTYEYPLWIEKAHTAKEITRVSFDDNTHIDFVGDHAIYSTDKKAFVNILNNSDFKIGTHVAKLENKKLVNATVTNIKTIEKTVKYYFVGSTTYYNIFAENILTTDHNLIISNLYGFDDNAKWPKEKEQILANENNLLDYSYFEDVLPRYLYEGFRVREAGYLINNNVINLDEFKTYITALIINPAQIKKPITKNNERYWMVTTSEDNINNTNKNNYLTKEGTIYTIPKSKETNFKGWYNTANNSIYKPGDKITVNHGIHLKAIYGNKKNIHLKNQNENTFINNPFILNLIK